MNFSIEVVIAVIFSTVVIFVFKIVVFPFFKGLVKGFNESTDGKDK